MVRRVGGNGNDILDGTNDVDQLAGVGGNDILNGFGGNDLLVGDDPSALFGGSDTLNGGEGADDMRGGKGNDRYIVDNVGDKVTEDTSGVLGGRDIVEASVSFTLTKDVENLTLTGTADINGTGNTLANTITGNTGKNTLNGLDGDDILNGGVGDDILIGGNNNDTLNGGDNNDILNGGAGTNSLNGGLGDDTYLINTIGAANTISDTAGTDTVQSILSFTLGAGVENLLLTGRGAVSGTGNGDGNEITGNGAANLIQGLAGDDTLNGGLGNDNLLGGAGLDVLSGGIGADRMEGGAGSDRYFVDNAGDVIVEAAGLINGIDLVESSVDITALAANVENLTLVRTATTAVGNAEGNTITGNELANTLDGGANNDILIGNAGDDLLIGNSGNDTLNGGSGNDTLDGGFGSDSYIFDSNAVFNSVDLGIDVIKNFASGLDKLVLDQTTFGPITNANVAIVANDAVAATSGALITYSSATGNIFFNQNGATEGFGTGGQFASINNAPSLAVNDFQFVA